MNAQHDHILMIGSIDASEQSAYAIHFCSLAKAFKKLGFSVEILIPKPSTNLWTIPLEDKTIKINKSFSARSLKLPNCFDSLLQLPYALYLCYRKKIKFIYVRMNILSFSLL